MKKIKVFLIAIMMCITSQVFAFVDTYQSTPDTVNSYMFSTESAKPLVNLERTHFNNIEIQKIESKYSTQNKTQSSLKTVANTQEEKQKTKFKDYFKGFVVEW